MLYAPGAALADQAFADLKIPHRICSLPDGSLLFLCTGIGLHFNMRLRPDGQALLWHFLGEAPCGQEGRLEYRAGDCTAVMQVNEEHLLELSLRSVQPLEDITDVRRLICKFLCLIAKAR